MPRAVHKATVLVDGRVLVTGGCSAPGCEGFESAQQSEIFDPVTGRFSLGPSMTMPRAGHTATSLRDGRVLLVGGYPGEGRPALAAVEIFDPRTGAFRAVPPLAVGRADHSATAMPDGRVLIAGGTDGNGSTLDGTEVFDPKTDRVVPGPPLTGARSGHVAAFTQGRLVLVGGTADLVTAVATTDVLTSGRWTAGPQLRQPRIKHAAVAMPNETVLVLGGATTTEGRDRLSSTEILSLGSSHSQPGPALSEGQYKLESAVTTLLDGRVVIAGGQRVEVYDPASRAMSIVATGPVPRRSFVSASTVSPSTVLIVGGYDAGITPTTDARLVRIADRR